MVVLMKKGALRSVVCAGKEYLVPLDVATELWQLRRSNERVLYKQCHRHAGLVMNFSCEISALSKVICPHCEEEKR